VGLDVAGGVVFVDGYTEGGVEVHPKLFWRDPAIGFLGAFGSVAYVDSTTAWSATLGGARYLGDWDIGASAGAGGTDGTGAGLFDAALGWYATDQLRLGGSAAVSTEATFIVEASVYWQPGPETSRFSIVGWAGGGPSSGDGVYTVGVNLVIHFAEPKSLKRQLREDRI
jgi:hypothetical protein